MPRLLIVDDEPSIADGLRMVLQAEGYEVEVAGTTVAALVRVEEQAFALAVVDLVLPDGDGLHLLRLLKAKAPDLEVIIVTGHSSIAKAVEATKQGAFHFVAKPFAPEELTALVAAALKHRRLAAEASDLRRRLVAQGPSGEIIGSAPAMKRVFDVLESVADSDANVLIVGESGTGKELVANAVHARSSRAAGPLVKINCAALPRDLMESELFGYARGAFTGAASDKPGLLEEAHRGSVLLDEIAEMPTDLQAKLLRVLEDRQVRRLGAGRSVPVDFRLISSTNRDPEAAVREGRLRADLFFRVNTVSVVLPPLRERTSDIPLLAQTFLERFRVRHARSLDAIDPEAYRYLLAYPWPGNVRELEHAIERAVLMARGTAVTVGDLPDALRVVPSAAAVSSSPAGSLEEIERVSIIRALESKGWNKQAAASVLGLRRPTLYSKMRRHGIPQRRPLGP
jgi:DNA-binding NtrC family response regulator